MKWFFDKSKNHFKIRAEDDNDREVLNRIIDEDYEATRITFNTDEKNETVEVYFWKDNQQ
jgi:hypothetical protein